LEICYFYRGCRPLISAEPMFLRLLISFETQITSLPTWLVT
jgi:hypothetical protein